jgi:CheY-like chemotaxis protein
LRILLVDDEDLVREGTAEMLRELGHDVHCAAGGAEALTLLAGPVKADVVVTDFKMPQMDGAELASRIRAHRPELPVLLITGYTGASEHAFDLPRLSKPFGMYELADALAALCERDQKVIPFRSR